MHKRVAQVGQHFEAIRQRLGEQALGGDDTEQFVIALRPAQPQRSYQNTADDQASLDSNLQVTFGQPEHVKVRGKFLARALAQVAQNDDGLAQLLQVTL